MTAIARAAIVATVVALFVPMQHTHLDPAGRPCYHNLPGGHA